MTKMAKAAVPAAVILFLMALTACDNAVDDNPGSGGNDGPVHFEGALKINRQQVWMQNKEAKRQSDEWYFKFTDNADINVFAFFSYDTEKKIISTAPQKIGSGKIDKGILNFEAPEPDAENLVDMDIIFPYALCKEYKDVTIEPAGVMGNIILPETSDGVYLNREGLFLKYSSVGMESIQFVYVDKDCQITGKPDVINWDQSYSSRTEKDLDLSLQKGWNTIYRMEVFDRESGYDNVSMGISNPNNFKWVLYIQ